MQTPRKDSLLAAFHSYESHPMLGRSFKKMSGIDRAYCIQFLNLYGDMDRDTLAMKINRLFVDGERPKNHAIICEMLTCANSR